MNQPIRKIIHIDMDAFFASVELRDRPDLRDAPVVVAWEGARSVICAASYPARKFGLRSAMPLSVAKRLCPHVVCLPPHFEKYQQASRHIHRIFARHTDLIEPLSLDEAYLDVTHNKQQMAYACDVATAIRHDILSETGLTASAGIAPNKFLAKIASDWRKPNGQTTIAPQQIPTFLQHLSLSKIPGVGEKTQHKMAQLGLTMLTDLLTLSRGELVLYFGKYGHRLYDLARGIDDRSVNTNREHQQISNETTLSVDAGLAEISAYIPKLCQEVWDSAAKHHYAARTVTVKLKTADFHTLTRSLSFSSDLHQIADFQAACMQLLQRMPQDLALRFRLIGVGLSQLHRTNEEGHQYSMW